MFDSRESMLWCTASDDPLSPGFFMFSCLSPFLVNIQHVLFSSQEKIRSHKGVLVFNLEDARCLETFLANFAQSKPQASALVLVFHDVHFLECPDLLSALSNAEVSASKVIRLYPWAHEMPSIGEGDIFPDSASYLFSYPFMKNRENSEYSGPNIEKPILLSMRGFREGRLSILSTMLKNANLASRTILLAPASEKEYYSKYLTHFEASEILVHAPDTVSDISKLIERSSLLINPCVSSIRSPSLLLMEAYHKKVPVLLSDFGPARSLPDNCAKYEVGPGEERNLADAVNDILLSGPGTQKAHSLELSFEFALEYANPESSALELKNILEENIMNRAPITETSR